ncbi:MAG: acetolactate synthase large subunit [Anaerolineae bacterium]|nr:acetolactate synthase large subunit [Anaerolineae bacterium]
MNGAESLIQTLVNGGVDVCFTNPGTSEMAFVAAVDRVPGMRTVLGLFEGVCTGAADGYARMAGKPACTLLHLGPGLGNGLANLHNARRAHSPLINIVGEHASWHLKHDAPLTSDIESIAQGVSGWIRRCASAASVPQDGAEAIVAAMQPPGQVATIIFPGDCMWNASSAPAQPLPLPAPAAVDGATIDQIAAILRRGERATIYIGNAALTQRGMTLAARIGAATGAKLLSDRFTGRMPRGLGVPEIERIAYPIPQALKQLEGCQHLVLVGAKAPVGFFGYPNLPSELWPADCHIHTLATLEQDIVSALEALAEALDAPHELPPVAYRKPERPTGALTLDSIWASVAAHLPEGAVFSDESVTSGRMADPFLAHAPMHDLLTVTGGSIGQGLPVAVGAAIACPGRKIINTEADGSAMYTIQSLWTMAREQLDVTTILFNNRAYRILQGEMKGVGMTTVGPKADAMLRIDQPTLDFVQLAQGMGVPASRATTLDEFNAAMTRAMQSQGPKLIEVMV